MVASDCPHTPLPRLRQLLLGDHAQGAPPGQVDGVGCLPTRDAMENGVGDVSTGTWGNLGEQEVLTPICRWETRLGEAELEGAGP